MIHIFVPEINEFISLQTASLDARLNEDIVALSISHYEDEITKFMRSSYYNRLSGYLFELFRQYFANLKLQKYMKLSLMRLRVLLEEVQKDTLAMADTQDQYVTRNLIATYEQIIEYKLGRQ